jgi:hypothetical protein
MKITIVFQLFISSAILLGCSVTNGGQKIPAEANGFSVTIEQDGKPVKINNKIVVLKPSAFDIVINIPAPMSLLLNASFDTKTYKPATENKHLDELFGFKETGMAEGRFNSDKEMYVLDEAPSYWYYDSDKDHRFNAVEHVGNRIICKRTVENLYNPVTEVGTKVTDNNKPLYLVFLTAKPGQDRTERIEVQRQCLEINWVR